MLLSEFDYELPEELIAQLPADKRENSECWFLSAEATQSRTNIFTILLI